MSMATLRDAAIESATVIASGRRCGTTPLLEHVDAYARDMAVWLKRRFIELARLRSAQRTISTGAVKRYPTPRSVCISSSLEPCSSSFSRRRPTWVSIARS